MVLRTRFSRMTAIVVVGICTSTALGLQRATQPTELQRGLLYADLWMQTSAEYVACCLLTYRLAGDQIERDARQSITDGRWRPDQTNGAPPAVIMDLDETVLDNGTFQTFLYDSGQNFSDELWDRFVTDHRTSNCMVPGATDF